MFNIQIFNTPKSNFFRTLYYFEFWMLFLQNLEVLNVQRTDKSIKNPRSLFHRRSQRGAGGPLNVTKSLLFLQFKFFLHFLFLTVINNNIDNQGPRPPFQFNIC